MIPFDPTDPFPFVPTYSYEDSKRHAEQADAWLGFRVDEVERAIKESTRISVKQDEIKQEFWVGLDLQSLQTPYLELRTAIETLGSKPGDKIVELGSGYSRLAHVLKRHAKGAHYIGFELVEQRVNEARRVLGDYQNAQIVLADLADGQFKPPEANVFFIYDFGSQQAIRKVLADLKALAKRHSFQVVGRGRATRQIIEREEPWLSQVFAPKHFPNFSIYKMASSGF
jgi:hypothetical protein